MNKEQLKEYQQQYVKALNIALKHNRIDTVRFCNKQIELYNKLMED